jgi:hypothetical protein
MNNILKSALSFVLVLIACFAVLAAAPDGKSPKPQYDEKGQLVRPSDYRAWMFLVQRWAYDEFAKSGKWPEQSMFVIDERDATSRGSINQKGHYQTDLMGLAVEVKDSAKNPDKWAYYAFSADGKSADAMPHGNGCFACHDAHAAVEHTFVQFYPTLKVMAKSFGSYNEAREQVADVK